MSASVNMIRKLDDVEPKVRDAFLCLIDEVEMKSQVISVGRGDFNELKDIVQNLAETQGQIEERVGELTEVQKNLAEAQGRTEQRVEELAEAQGRTEQRVGELAEAQKNLAEAQGRTEQRVEELAEAQKELVEAQIRTEKKIDKLDHSLTNQIAALGSRWGSRAVSSYQLPVSG